MTSLPRLLLFVLVLCSVAPAGCGSTPEQDAVSTITRLGGTIDHDLVYPADGGVEIDLTGRNVTGNALVPLKDIKGLHTEWHLNFCKSFCGKVIWT